MTRVHRQGAWRRVGSWFGVTSRQREQVRDAVEPTRLIHSSTGALYLESRLKAPARAPDPEPEPAPRLSHTFPEYDHGIAEVMRLVMLSEQIERLEDLTPRPARVRKTPERVKPGTRRVSHVRHTKSRFAHS